MIPGSLSIRRRFVDVPGGQVHLRYGGEHRDRVPVVMVHASPASSRMREPLLRCFAETRAMFAPDTPGNGDSTPPPGEAPAFDAFVGAHVAALDALGLDRVDLYGTNTGANIACEIAIRHPGRVRCIILDGVSLYGEAERTERNEWPFRRRSRTRS